MRRYEADLRSSVALGRNMCVVVDVRVCLCSYHAVEAPSSLFARLHMFGFGVVRLLHGEPRRYPDLVNDVSTGGARPLHMCGMGKDRCALSFTSLQNELCGLGIGRTLVPRTGPKSCPMLVSIAGGVPSCAVHYLWVALPWGEGACCFFYVGQFGDRMGESSVATRIVAQLSCAPEVPIELTTPSVARWVGPKVSDRTATEAA